MIKETTLVNMCKLPFTHCFVTKSTALNIDCFYKVWNSPTSRKYKRGQINKFNVIIIIIIKWEYY